MEPWTTPEFARDGGGVESGAVLTSRDDSKHLSNHVVKHDATALFCDDIASHERFPKKGNLRL